MKEIKAYVHRMRIADVIAALKDCPCWREAQAARRHNLALYVVKGSSRPLDNEELHYSLDIGDEVVNEYKFELMRRAGLQSVLLSGDNRLATERLAREVGIDVVHTEVLPAGKAEVVRGLQARSRKVAMVGDGINDAPALMQADVGIAMGGGTDIAIESADIVILSNRLAALPLARDISRRSYAKMLQNVSLAFLFNGIGIPLAASGLIHPIWAMSAMAFSVTAIFLNSLWGRPALFIDAVLSVGKPGAPGAAAGSR